MAERNCLANHLATLSDQHAKMHEQLAWIYMEESCRQLADDDHGSDLLDDHHVFPPCIDGLMDVKHSAGEEGSFKALRRALLKGKSKTTIEG